MSDNLCLSVIIPFYNAENYLQDCLNSLFKQDFKKPIEIIMINDASTDKSIDIIEKNKSSIINILSLKNNEGPASARNLGLNHAKGEYIFFLDADDTIQTNTLSTLYYDAIKNDFDLVISDKQIIDKSTNKLKNTFIYDYDKVFKNGAITEEIKKRLFNPLYQYGLHLKFVDIDIETLTYKML